MSIMIDLPPAMAQEAREYATVQGTTLERMLVDCLRAEHRLKSKMARTENATRSTDFWQSQRQCLGSVRNGPGLRQEEDIGMDQNTVAFARRWARRYMREYHPHGLGEEDFENRIL